MNFHDKINYNYPFAFQNSAKDGEELKNQTEKKLNKVMEALKATNKILITKPIGYIEAKSIAYGRYSETIVEFLSNNDTVLSHIHSEQINRVGKSQLNYESQIYQKIVDKILSSKTVQILMRNLKEFNDNILNVTDKNGNDMSYNYRIVWYTYYNPETKIV